VSYLTIVDTDILIDASRRVEQALGCLSRIERESRLAVSVVTQMELMVGCRNKAEMRAVEQFLGRFEVLKLSEPISDLAIALLREYRLSHGLLIPDALIAATAIVLAQPLVSGNAKDYRFIPDLELASYPA